MREQRKDRQNEEIRGKGEEEKGGEEKGGESMKMRKARKENWVRRE
jgi:hypothetical protein